MRRRTIRISVRLTPQEHRRLQEQTRCAGLKIEPFIRALIMGVELKPKPPDTYMGLLRELNAIGKNVNQIAKVANSRRDISPEQIDNLHALLGDIWRKVKGL